MYSTNSAFWVLCLKGCTFFLRLRTLEEVDFIGSVPIEFSFPGGAFDVLMQKSEHTEWSGSFSGEFLLQKSHQRRAENEVGLPLRGLQCLNYLLSYALG